MRGAAAQAPLAIRVGEIILEDISLRRDWLGDRLVNPVVRVVPGLRKGFHARHAIAQEIAAKSPISIRGTKEMILYTRDHSVADGLNYIATWNASMLSKQDLEAGVTAQMEKKRAVYED